MTLPGETVATGAPHICPDCRTHIEGPQVMMSGAGYYIGYSCNCGPYSRESGYYVTRKDAELMLASAPVVWQRDTAYNPSGLTITHGEPTT